MDTIYTLSMLTALVFIIIYTTKFDWKGIVTKPFLSIIVLGVAVRLFASRLNIGYEVDINCFKAWSGMLADRGFGRFYSSPEFTDYPPGYMYVLFIIGVVRKIFNFGYSSDAFTLLIKTPAIVCDILTGIAIYWIAAKKMKPSFAWFIAMAYVLNPAIIINSAVWGQTDSIYTLVLLISIYFMSGKKYHIGYPVFAVAVIIKPQSLIFSPIYIYAAFEILSLGDYKKKYFAEVFKYFAACVAVIAICILPFAIRYDNRLIIDFMPVITQYTSTIASYPYATLNAYNFYSLIGANWRPVSESFIFGSYSTFGIICIELIVVLGFYLLHRNKEKANYFYVAALINVLVFMFSVRMHERYLFPTLAFLLVAYISKEESFDKKKIFIPLYVFFSLTLFINCADVINMLQNGNQVVYLEKTLPPLSAANFVLTIIMIYVAIKSFTSGKPADEQIIKKNAEILGKTSEDEYSKTVAESSTDDDTAMLGEYVTAGEAQQIYEIYEPNKPMSKLDYILMFGLTAIYAVVAFINLGNTSSPQTTWSPGYMKSIIVEFDGINEIDQIQFLTGAKENQSFDIDFSETGEFSEYVYVEDTFAAGITRIKADAVFSWQSVSVSANAKAARITPTSGWLQLQELGFKKNGDLVSVTYDEHVNALFDEQELIPEKTTFMNSTIFDEIYHARTAYEFIQKTDVYEWTHPPLGKVIISWGIRLFGMTPFGWRFSGTLFGVMMLPVMYLFGKRMFKSTKFAFFSTLLLSLDFMHFAQSRISTIDTFVTFFIMTSFYFMYSYFDMKITKENILKSFMYLALSGFFIGCAAAAKWPGIYAAGGLAVVFFVSVYRRMTHEAFGVKNMTVTFALCCVFFIAVPLVIYVLSYIPYMQSPGKGSIVSVIRNQQEMFSYHANQNATHPFSSEWWKWPFNIRPLLFANTSMSPGKNSAISTFGNPLIWWMGVIAFFYGLSAYSEKKNGTRDRNALFLIIAFLAQFLPWTLVTRSTYIYHYFPSVPFIILLIAYMFKNYAEVKIKHSTYIYAAVVFVVFIMFFPVISGIPVNISFVHRFLKWLPSWSLM